MIERVRSDTEEILQLFHKSDGFSEKAIEYLLIGTKLVKWPRKAFLNFFKVIELISDKFLLNWKTKSKKKIRDIQTEELRILATRKRKILNACDILGLRDINRKMGELVRIRNKVDAAHPALESKLQKKLC